MYIDIRYMGSAAVFCKQFLRVTVTEVPNRPPIMNQDVFGFFIIDIVVHRKPRWIFRKTTFVIIFIRLTMKMTP